MKHLLDTRKNWSKSGIYRILNTTNNKCYIGSAVNLYHRKTVHLRFLRKGVHHSILLQRAFNKYKEESFVFEVLEECDKSILILKEQFYIDICNPEYNIQKTAGSSLGRVCTEEAKRKLSLKNKGKKMSKETCEKMSNSRKGITPSVETREKLRVAHTGKIMSKESRIKIGNASRNRKPDSPDTSLKKSIATILRNKKPITQYTLDWTFIKNWDSIKECSEFLGGEKSNISRAIKFGLTAKGFRFKFIDL